MSIPGTAGSEDTLGERAALLTDAVGDQLGPVGLPAHVRHHVLGVADVLAQQANIASLPRLRNCVWRVIVFW